MLLRGEYLIRIHLEGALDMALGRELKHLVKYPIFQTVCLVRNSAGGILSTE